MDSRFLIINYMQVESDLVMVGATDNQRWEWDREGNDSGINAFTFVWVTLKGTLESDFAIQEAANFHVRQEDPLKKLAINSLYELFDVAWDIKKSRLTEAQAYDQYFGFHLGTKPEFE